MTAVVDRLRDIAEMARYSAAETELLKLADELDGGDVELGSNPWRLVIDQVMHLAVNVYGLSVDPPTTPEQVRDLWGAVVVEIAECARVIERDMATETTREIEGQALDALADARTEAKTFQDAADQWHLLTEALPNELRIIPGDAPDDAATWLPRIREALWHAYGIGRRHQRDGVTFVGQTERSGLTPFDATDTTPRS